MIPGLAPLASAAIFSLDPLPDVRRAALQCGTACFTPRQELHRVAIHERHLVEIDRQRTASPLVLHHPPQLHEVLRCEASAEREPDGLAVHRSLYSEHGP